MKTEIRKTIVIYENKDEKEIFGRIENEVIIKILSMENENIKLKKTEIKDIVSVDNNKKEITIKGELNICVRTTKEYEAKIRDQISKLEKELHERIKNK